MDVEDKLLKLATAVGTLKEQVKGLSSKTDTITKLEGPQGLKGDKGDKGDSGLPGVPGRDGKDGVDGKDGLDGKDGVGIVNAEIDFDGSLKLKLSDGNEIDAGSVYNTLDSSSSTSMPAVLKQIAAGPRIYVQATTPTDAQVGDIWFDIS